MSTQEEQHIISNEHICKVTDLISAWNHTNPTAAPHDINPGSSTPQDINSGAESANSTDNELSGSQPKTFIITVNNSVNTNQPQPAEPSVHHPTPLVVQLPPVIVVNIENTSQQKKSNEEKLNSDQKRTLEENRLAEDMKKAMAEKRLAEENHTSDKALQEKQLAEEKKVLEEKRAVEEKRLAEQIKKAEEEKKLAEEKRLAEKKISEEKRILEEKQAEQAKKDEEEKKLAEEKRISNEKRQAEEKRLAEQAKKVEEEKKLIEEKRIAEEKKVLEEKRAVEEKRLAEQTKKAEEEKKLAEEKRLSEERRLAEEKRVEEKRLAEEKVKTEENRKPEENTAAQVTSATESKEVGYKVSDLVSRWDHQPSSSAASQTTNDPKAPEPQPTQPIQKQEDAKAESQDEPQVHHGSSGSEIRASRHNPLRNTIGGGEHAIANEDHKLIGGSEIRPSGSHSALHHSEHSKMPHAHTDAEVGTAHHLHHNPLEHLPHTPRHQREKIEYDHDEPHFPATCNHIDHVTTVAEAFDHFRKANDLHSTLAYFEQIAQLGKIHEILDTGTPVEFYESLKGLFPHSHHTHQLFDLIDKRRKLPGYDSLPCGDKRCLVVGSGPSGLRFAIEAAMLNARVFIVEKRWSFSRRNVMHMWPYSIQELRNIGVKYFHGRFCVGTIHHVPIRTLQLALLKIGLVMGVKIFTRTSYLGVKSAHNELPIKVALDPPIPEVEKLDINVLVGADGEHSRVADDFDFQKKLFKAGEAIGVTTNFVNTNTPEENSLAEFNGAYLYKQEWFDTLKANSGVELENLVYYKDETHYFVMTATKKSLLSCGVLRAECTTMAQLLAPTNVDKAELAKYVRHVADYVNLPPTCQFEKTNLGNDDVQIFDFTKKHAAIDPLHMITKAGQDPTMVFVIGDALIEPFWPLGTGAARGILGALDAAWFMWKSVGAKDDEKRLNSIKTESTRVYHRLYACGPDDLRTEHVDHSADPGCRYRGVAAVSGMQ